MPLQWFRCPDGTTTKITDCLANCTSRCLTLPTIKLIASERKWTGTPSTTQMLNGTMQTFLKITQPYVVDPQDRIFILLGIKSHSLLEDAAKELHLPSEIALTDGNKDIFDLLEPDNGGWILTDYKVWGSYRVAKALGMIATGRIADPSGAKYKTTTKYGKAGTVKMITTFSRVPDAVDLFEPELQLNRYRVMLEERGLQIHKMQLQIMVRDAGLAVARSRGITQAMYLVEIDRLEDSIVTNYFDGKKASLLTALEQGNWNTPCSEYECWEGTKCKRYCEVAKHCPKGIMYQEDK